MLKKEAGEVTITCDKCGFTETASELRYNDAFFLSGWGLFPNARKYTHQCFKCMPKRYKMSTKWAQKMFPPK